MMNATTALHWLMIGVCVTIVLLSAALLLSPLQQVFADVDCSSTSSLALGAQASKTTAGGTICFRTYLAPGTAILNLALQAVRGDFDLYVAQGSNVSPLRDALHKFTLSPIASDDPMSTFVVQRPQSGYYTIGVTPRSTGSSSFKLKLSTGATAAAQSSASQCSGSVCSSSYPLTAVVDASIGSAFGARAIFPIEVQCPGAITARASWSGSAQRLALILNGPGQVGYFDRSDGQSPLTVQYTATSTDTRQGSRWWVSLVNFAGGTADGMVTIDYPDPDACATFDWFGNLRVESVTDEEVRLTVDYAYSGSHGDNVNLAVYALHNGQKQSWFGYRPTSISRGSGKATVDLVLLGDRNPPANLTTEQLQFEMYEGGQASFYQQALPYARNWTPSNSIDTFRVLNETDTEVTFAVDYYYAGNRGSNIGLGAYAFDNGRQLSWFGYRPAQVSPGAGTAIVTLVLLPDNSSAPPEFTTDQVQFEMYVGGGGDFAARRFDYFKRWTTSPAGDDLRERILDLVRASSVPNSYPRQAERFVTALSELLGEAPYGSDAGDRINGVVGAVWGDWVNRATQGGFDVASADPGSHGFSPFRQLVIRMIQGRQASLDDAAFAALYSFLTRREDPDVWRSQIDGVIGALNREFFR